MTVTREQLYDEVWAEPMTTVASRYEVSASFLARVCSRLNIPRPPRGYWAQLEVGSAPARPSLPASGPGDELEWTKGALPRPVPRALPSPPSSPIRPTKPLAERTGLHALIVGAREHFDAGRVGHEGYLKPLKKLLVDVFATKGAIQRALEVANSLFVTLEDRGHSVVLAPRDIQYRRPEVDHREAPPKQGYIWDKWSPYRPTTVFIGTVAFGLTLYELSESVEVRYHNGKYVPVAELPQPKRGSHRSDGGWKTHKDIASGRLCLRAYSPYPRATWQREWREPKGGALHTSFGAIVREIEAAAPIVAKMVEAGEREAERERVEWEKQRRIWEREDAERRRAKAIKESREDLLEIIEGWALARRIEAFLEEARREAAERSTVDQASILERIAHAKALFGDSDVLGSLSEWKLPDER